MSMRGMNLRDARRLWIRLGGTADNKNCTGEEVYRHPQWPKPITVNKRRKDAPLELIKVLARLMRA